MNAREIFGPVQQAYAEGDVSVNLNLNLIIFAEESVRES